MWTQLRKNAIMDYLNCKYEDKKSHLKTAANGGSSTLSSTSTLMQTPTMTSGKIKKNKRKTTLQSSTQSLESSGDKKDNQFSQLAIIEKQPS